MAKVTITITDSKSNIHPGGVHVGVDTSNFLESERGKETPATKLATAVLNVMSERLNNVRR